MSLLPRPAKPLDSIDSPLSSTMLVHYKEQRAVEKLSTDLLGGFSPSNTLGATVGLIRDEKPTLNTTHACSAEKILQLSRTIKPHQV
jgi:hypothetical protein